MKTDVQTDGIINSVYEMFNTLEEQDCKKILVVDDEEAIVEMLRVNLRQSNYEVITAFDGEEALKKAQVESPDLILLDYMLPLLSGPEVAEMLKYIPITADIPIIFLTARNDNDSIVRGLKTGAADYVTKPFSISELLARVETQLKLKDALDKLKKTETKLRKANSIKDRLFTVFIHDIRAPFHTLGGYITLINQRYDRLEESKRREILGKIHQNSNHIQNLLENLLQWSQLESELFNWNPRTVNLRETALRIEKLYAAQLVNSRISLSVDIDPFITIHADEAMVEAVIRNLLQNAIKFTPANGTIRVEARTLGDDMEISITDSGVGICEEDLSKLFQAEHRVSKIGLNGENGTGMGLILCRKFVEMNGGDISVVSTVGKGTRFCFTLPRYTR